jgi:hypothetical protein
MDRTTRETPLLGDPDEIQGDLVLLRLATVAIEQTTRDGVWRAASSSVSSAASSSTDAVKKSA